jgi:hypothetical protein
MTVAVRFEEVVVLISQRQYVIWNIEYEMASSHLKDFLQKIK